jgi:RNA polymerase sigma factor (sigma-70 family)
VESGVLRNPARLAGRAVLGTQSDQRLVELVRGGSEPAFEAIVERYRGPLRRYCRQMAPRSCVDDVVQHTFLSAYLALTSDGRDLNLKPWLFRVTHNAALDALRREAWSSEGFDESYEGDRPDLVLEHKNSLRTLLSDLGNLPERQRAALVLREMEGRSHDEIARELGVTGGAARQLLNRARNGLRAAASALLPPVLFLPAEAKGDRHEVIERIAELASGPGAAAGVAKAGAVVATTGAIGAAALSNGGLEPPAPAGERSIDSKGAGIVRGAAPTGGTVAAVPRERRSQLSGRAHDGGGSRAGGDGGGAERSPGGSGVGVHARDENEGGAGAQGPTGPGPPSDDDDGPGDEDGPDDDDGPGDDAADTTVSLPERTSSGDDAGEDPDPDGLSPHSDSASVDDDAEPGED